MTYDLQAWTQDSGRRSTNTAAPVPSTAAAVPDPATLVTAPAVTVAATSAAAVTAAAADAAAAAAAVETGNSWCSALAVLLCACVSSLADMHILPLLSDR